MDILAYILIAIGSLVCLKIYIIHLKMLWNLMISTKNMRKLMKLGKNPEEIRKSLDELLKRTSEKKNNKEIDENNSYQDMYS